MTAMPIALEAPQRDVDDAGIHRHAPHVEQQTGPPHRHDLR